MTKRPYDPALKAQIDAAMKAAEPFAEAQRRRLEAMRKARRDLFQLREIGVLPPDDAA